MRLLLYYRFPEIPIDPNVINEFLEIPTTGLIPFDALNVEKCVLASGKLSIEFEHFIDDFSKTLNEEFGDKGKLKYLINFVLYINLLLVIL